MATWKKVVVSGSNAELNTLRATSVTASLLGTATNADNATNAISASYAVSASYLIGASATSSYAITASYAENANTANSALTATSASYATNAATASYADTLDGLDSTAFVQIAGTQTVTGAKTFREIVTLGVSGATNGQLDLIENVSTKKISLQVQDSSADLSFLDNAGSSLATLYNNGDGLELLSGNFIGNLSGNADTATTASYVLNAVSASYADSVTWNNVSAKPSGIISASAAGTSQGQIKLNGVDVNITGLQTTSNPTFANLTVSDNLVVNGTASFINTENLLVRDPFVLINSGSSALTDSGIVSQYNSSGEGSAFYIEATDTGTYGRWAVAYGVQQGFVSVTADEYVVTAKKSSGAPPAEPTWGGANNGFGNIYVNSDNGEIYIYA